MKKKKVFFIIISILIIILIATVIIIKKNENAIHNANFEPALYEKVIPEGSIELKQIEISSEKAMISITDKNEKKCDNINYCTISKWENAEENTGMDEYYNMNSENSTVGFMSTEPEYTWKNLTNINSNYKCLNVENSGNESTITVDFVNAYNKLDTGKYKLMLANDDLIISINIQFEIKDNGETEILSSTINYK